MLGEGGELGVDLPVGFYTSVFLIICSCPVLVC